MDRGIFLNRLGQTLLHNSHDRKKISWHRFDRVTKFDLCMAERVTGKRKNCMENMGVCDKPNYDENDNKRPRFDKTDLMFLLF